MSAPLSPADAPRLVTILRGLCGSDVTKVRFAQRAGLHPTTVRRYELGSRLPSRRAIQRMAAVAGVPVPLIDSLLLPALGALRLAGPGSAGGDSLEELVGFFLARLTALQIELQEAAEASREPARSSNPEELWARLAPHSPPARRLLVRHLADFQQHSFAAWLREQSARMAADREEEALDLAQLAQEIVRRIPGAAAPATSPGGDQTRAVPAK